MCSVLTIVDVSCAKSKLICCCCHRRCRRWFRRRSGRRSGRHSGSLRPVQERLPIGVLVQSRGDPFRRLVVSIHPRQPPCVRFLLVLFHLFRIPTPFHDLLLQ